MPNGLAINVDDAIFHPMLSKLPSSDVRHVLFHTRDVWKSAPQAKFFVTGGTGFFGKWLQETFAHCRRELRLKTTMTILTRDPDRARAAMRHLPEDSGIDYVQGDVRHLKPLDSGFTHVIHAAAHVRYAWDSLHSLETLDISYRGTQNVLNHTLANRASLLLISSGAIYGPQPESVKFISEEQAGGPNSASVNSAYSEGKRVAETMCKAHAEVHGTDVRIARCFNFIGPHLPLDGAFALGRVMKSVLTGELTSVPGTGLERRSYLHMADLSTWLWTIALLSKRNEVYNVGSDEVITNAELLRLVGSSNATCNQSIGRNQSYFSYVPSIEKARRELGLEVRIPFRVALAGTLNWFLPMADTAASFLETTL